MYKKRAARWSGSSCFWSGLSFLAFHPDFLPDPVQPGIALNKDESNNKGQANNGDQGKSHHVKFFLAEVN
jgi:hypothetical protein